MSVELKVFIDARFLSCKWQVHGKKCFIISSNINGIKVRSYGKSHFNIFFFFVFCMHQTHGHAIPNPCVANTCTYMEAARFGLFFLSNAVADKR